eukprot:7566126-Karenia_brevis.AAC.1
MTAAEKRVAKEEDDKRIAEEKAAARKAKDEENAKKALEAKIKAQQEITNKAVNSALSKVRGQKLK